MTTKYLKIAAALLVGVSGLNSCSELELDQHFQSQSGTAVSAEQKNDVVVVNFVNRSNYADCRVYQLLDSKFSLFDGVFGASDEVLGAMDSGISFEHMPSGIDTMTIVVHEDEFMHKEQRVVSAIHRLAQPDSVEIESDLALIAVVGRGMKSMRGTAGRIFSALAHAQVNVRMIDQGSSELNIIIGVDNVDFEVAVRAIYDIFVKTRF